MSAQFIIRYNGAGVRTVNGALVLGLPNEADIFVSEADAWYAAYKLDLPPHKLQVVSLYAEQQRA